MAALGMFLILSGLFVAFATGAHWGRLQERSKPTLSAVDVARRLEAANNAEETTIRLKRGLPMVHQDPEHAARIRKLRIRKR